MQEVVKGSLVLAFMQLPTKLQEAHLKKFTSIMIKCLDMGVVEVQRRFSVVGGGPP